MISMDKVYHIMHYLNDSHLDRIYPVDVAQLSSFKGDSKVLELNHHSFVGINEVRFYVRVLSDEEDTRTSRSLTASCEICADHKGGTPLFVFEDVELEVNYDEQTVITFDMDYVEQMARKSHNLTGVHSLKFKFDEEVHRCFIHNVEFRSNDFRYTLETIEQSYYDGQNYVRDKLNNSKVSRGVMDIPVELERYVYMCAGAYAWLIVWEKEAKPMKEPKSESNNYADRLFGSVDKAIEAYLKTFNNDPNANYINPIMIKPRRVSWGVSFGKR